MESFKNDADMTVELELARKKVAAGARFIITPPVFNVELFTEFMKRTTALGVPIIPTVFLIKSVAIARYIANSEPEAHLSEATIKRIRKASDREMEGIKIAGETIKALSKIAQGVKIQTLGWEHRLSQILDVANL